MVKKTLGLSSRVSCGHAMRRRLEQALAGCRRTVIALVRIAAAAVARGVWEKGKSMIKAREEIVNNEKTTTSCSSSRLFPFPRGSRVSGLPVSECKRPFIGTKLIGEIER
jgi:hypothetical protein